MIISTENSTAKTEEGTKLQSPINKEENRVHNTTVKKNFVEVRLKAHSKEKRVQQKFDFDSAVEA